MIRLAAATTIPVTPAAMQDSSNSSFRALAMFDSPDADIPLRPHRALPYRGKKVAGCGRGARFRCAGGVIRSPVVLAQSWSAGPCHHEKCDRLGLPEVPGCGRVERDLTSKEAAMPAKKKSDLFIANRMASALSYRWASARLRVAGCDPTGRLTR